MSFLKLLVLTFFLNDKLTHPKFDTARPKALCGTMISFNDHSSHMRKQAIFLSSNKLENTGNTLNLLQNCNLNYNHIMKFYLLWIQP